MSSEVLRMGTRASALARGQANQFATLLTEKTGVDVEVVLVRTEGDQLSFEGRIPPGGDSTGVFTRALDEALRAGRCDFAVHSLKDMPTADTLDIALAAVPERADSRDALVVASRLDGVTSLDEMPRGARIATSSPRRVAQLLNRRPDFVCTGLQGNIDTRLKRLEEGIADAILLACAGLDRLALSHRITRRLPGDEILQAPGQGALGVVCLATNSRTRDILAQLDDAASRAASLSERSFLNALRGGCRAPVGASAVIEHGSLVLKGVVLSLDGRKRIGGILSGSPANAEDIGRELAENLLMQGASELVSSARTSPS